MERVRDVVVAAIDERRLMVSQFYIESREQLLRASEEKYRNSIDHAPDPMYEIEPDTWKVLRMNAAALHMLRDENRARIDWKVADRFRAARAVARPRSSRSRTW